MKHAAILAVLLAGFFLLARGNTGYGPYGYDEADCMFAASRGTFANMMDSPTMGLMEFLKLGMQRGSRTELSELIRNSDDLVFYRHWHGPLYIDWLRISSPLASPEPELRALNYAFPVLTSLVIYFGTLWVLPGSLAGAALATALFLFCYPVVQTTELAPHQLFVLCFMATLFLLAKLMQTGERRFWYAAIVTTALAFCVLEVAFVLILTVLVCGHLERPRLRADLKFAAASIGVFAATVLVVWPAAVFKLSFLKAYLFMAYLAVFRKGAWGHNVSLWDTWWARFSASPVQWIVVLLAAAAFFAIRAERTRLRPVVVPFGLFTVLMIAATFRVNTDTPRYGLTFFPALVVLAALIAGEWLVSGTKPIVRSTAVAVVCAIAFTTTYREIVPRRPAPNPNRYALLALIRDHQLTDKRLLVPQELVPTVHYYFPGTRVRGYLEGGPVPGGGDGVDAVIYRDSTGLPALVPVRPVH